MDYVLTHQECNQKLETETGECGVDGCGDGGGMLYGVGKRLLELWMGPLPLPVYARGLPLLWVFLGSAFFTSSSLPCVQCLTPMGYVSVCSSLSLLYYIVLLLSRACLELLVDEPPLLVEVDGHMKELFNFLRDDQVIFLFFFGIPTGRLATVYHQDYLRLNDIKCYLTTSRWPL